MIEMKPKKDLVTPGTVVSKADMTSSQNGSQVMFNEDD